MKQIKTVVYIGANFAIWSAWKNSLVKWVDANHPDLNGFIHDLSKTGAENYLKAIDLFKLEKNEQPVSSNN